VLRIRLSADDLLRVRFAPAAAPVLESVLMLFELRNRPHATASGPDHRRDDWRVRVRSRFPEEARPLRNLILSRDQALLLDVLTPDPDAAFQFAAELRADLHDRKPVERPMPDGIPPKLCSYFRSEPAGVRPIDSMLHTFHKAHLAPYWSPITERFDDDVDHRTATMRDQGVAAMLESLHPGLHLDGSTLYSPYPGDREVDLSGRGMILMPSVFWTGRPLLTWNPLDPAHNVLVYPAKPTSRRQRVLGDGGRESGHDAHEPRAALAKLMGPTRAAVLGRLRHPDTTSGIARDLGISVSSVSDHTAALRDAGLISSQRTGQSVEHRLTRLGHSLLTHTRSPSAA
jgi:DNA-binding transcriptional ArsR family regulator